MYNGQVSNRDAGTYLYVKDGAEPRETAIQPERMTLRLDPPRPAEPISRVRLVRPTVHAQRCDPLLSMLHCPDSPQGDAVRTAAAPLADIEGPLIITGTAGAPRARMAIELAAALVETGGFAAIIDAGAHTAQTMGVDRFDGLLSQFEQRRRDPSRPLELLYITWRCGLLPLELDRDATVEAVEAARDAASLGCTRCVIVAPAVDDPTFRRFAALGTVVLIATPDDLPTGRLASAVGSTAGAQVAGVIITHLEAAAAAPLAGDEGTADPDISAPDAAEPDAADLIAADAAHADTPGDASTEPGSAADGADIAVHPPMNDDGVSPPAESIEQAD